MLSLLSRGDIRRKYTTFYNNLISFSGSSSSRDHTGDIDHQWHYMHGLLHIVEFLVFSGKVNVRVEKSDVGRK